MYEVIRLCTECCRYSAYHDDCERHSESGDTGKERRRSYESHRSRIHPQPELIRRDASVDVDEHTADCSTVQTSDKPARHCQRHLLSQQLGRDASFLFSTRSSDLSCYLRGITVYYLLQCRRFTFGLFIQSHFYGTY